VRLNLGGGDVPDSFLLGHWFHRIEDLVNLIPKFVACERGIYLALWADQDGAEILEGWAYHDGNTSAHCRGDRVALVINHGPGELVDSES